MTFETYIIITCTLSVLCFCTFIGLITAGLGVVYLRPCQHPRILHKVSKCDYLYSAVEKGGGGSHCAVFPLTTASIASSLGPAFFYSVI